jgi:hypothetical protein
VKTVYFKKTIGKYRKGTQHQISYNLANVYFRSNIAVDAYENKVIPEPVAKQDFEPTEPVTPGVVDYTPTEPVVSESPAVEPDLYDTLDIEGLRNLARSRGI